MPGRVVMFCLALLTLAAGNRPATVSAQTDSTPKPGSGPAVALVISGGASLGVYEAGYLYATGEVLKRQGIPVRVATGASAGSGNAFLAALNSCAPPNDSPEQDLGYRFWLAQGFESLYQRDSVTPLSALIASPGITHLRHLLDEVWQRGLPQRCDVSLGIAVSRLTPLDVPLQAQLTVPRQLLYFSNRIRGQGSGLPPTIRSIAVPGSIAPQLLLPLGAADVETGAAQDRERLMEVIAASSAFPYAFPPVRLGYCIYPATAVDACREAEEKDRFIDGGVFDNVPLGLAGGLSRADSATADSTLFIYLDPALRAYPVAEPAAANAPPSVFSHGVVLGLSFVRQARTTELYELLESASPTLNPGRLLVASNRFPQASGFVGNFLGLFEREFRRFDFFLGMYDGLHDLASWDRLNTDRGRQALEALVTTPEWLPLRCLRVWYDSTSVTPDPGCAGRNLRDFRILAQLALNRVYSQCRELSPEQRARPIAHYHCRRGAEGALPPQFATPVRPLDSLETLSDTARKETALHYNLRLLAAYGFHFRDLGLSREEAGEASRVLARRFREMIEAVAARQPTATMRRAVRLGTIAVGSIYYEPARGWWYVVVGTAQEAGGSTALGGLPDWLRISGAVRVEGIVSLLTRDPNRFATALFAGPDFELRPFTRLRHMITIAPRVGYQLSQGDHFHSRKCDAAGTNGDGRDCSQVVLQAATALIAYERVRLQVSLDYYTRKVAFDDRRHDVQIALGVQF